MARQKDFETLILAFERVLKVRPSRLLILGEGGERATHEGLVERLGFGYDVALPGFVKNP